MRDMCKLLSCWGNRFLAASSVWTGDTLSFTKSYRRCFRGDHRNLFKKYIKIPHCIIAQDPKVQCTSVLSQSVTVASTTAHYVHMFCAACVLRCFDVRRCHTCAQWGKIEPRTSDRGAERDSKAIAFRLDGPGV